MRSAIIQFMQFQADYFLFCYGFAFILLASISFLMLDRSKYDLSWFSLGLFGVFHGLREWIILLLEGFDPLGVSEFLDSGLLFLSFLSLVEFGRSNTAAKGSRWLGRWIYILLPALICTPLLWGAGFEGVRILAWYVLGVSGAMWASIVFYRASGVLKEGRNFLILAALGMFFYAFKVMISVPKEPFFPASFLNAQFFFDIFGFPPQVAGGLMIFLVLVSSVRFYESRNHLYARKKILPTFWLFPTLILVLFAGGVVTERACKETDLMIRNALKSRAETAAASFDSGQIEKLTGSPADEGTPAYEAVRDQLESIHRANPDCHYVYLIGFREEQVYFLDDSRVMYAQNELPSRPGDVYESASPTVIRAFSKGEAFTEGPLTDRWGTWVTGYGIIRDEASGKVVAILGIDLDVKKWAEQISLERKDQISKIMLLAFLFIGFFVFYERMREAAFKLNESRVHLAQAQALAHIGSWIFEEGARSPVWSEELFRIFGWDRKLGEPSYAEHERFIHPQDWEAFDSTFKNAMSHGGDFEIEIRIFLSGGVLRYLVCKAHVERGIDGQVARLIGTFQDVTERKISDQALRLRDQAISESSCGIMISDATPDLRVLYVNSCFERMTGQAANEMIGCPCPFLAGKYRDDPALDPLRSALRTGKECRVSFLCQRKDRSTFWSELSLAPVHGERGRIVNYIGIQTDITDRKEVEHLKSEFVSIVSHELRSPIIIIQESISQIVDGLLGEVNERQKQVLKVTLHAVKRLVRLINDLLDIAKIEAGKISLKRESVDLVDVSKEVLLYYRSKVEKRGIAIRVVPADRPVFVSADRDLLMQVLENLVGNAVKFTEKGFIEISIVEKESMAECNVSDSGCGIDEKNLPKVFEKFQQFASPSPGSEKGTGLGLAIAKAIVEAHHGKIWVTSRAGHGTIFSFVIPREISPG